MKRSPDIKIGHEAQADLPIHLTRFGALVCGQFKYSGPKKKALAEIYLRIYELALPYSDGGLLDVSEYDYWDAINIYEEYIGKPFNESIGAEQLERLSVETEVVTMLLPVREIFKKAVGKKWRRICKNMSFDDPNRPSQGWHILLPPEKNPTIPE